MSVLTCSNWAVWIAGCSRCSSRLIKASMTRTRSGTPTPLTVASPAMFMLTSPVARRVFWGKVRLSRWQMRPGTKRLTVSLIRHSPNQTSARIPMSFLSAIRTVMVLKLTAPRTPPGWLASMPSWGRCRARRSPGRLVKGS